MSEHTPGPLTITGPSPGGESDDDGGDYAIREGDGYIIGEAIYKVDFVARRPAKANAQLWATAGKLLAALEKSTDELEGLLDRAGNDRWLVEERVRLNRVVIAKAAGR